MLMRLHALQGNKLDGKIEEIRNAIYNSLEQWMERYKMALRDFAGDESGTDSEGSERSTSVEPEYWDVHSARDLSSLGSDRFLDLSPSRPSVTSQTEDFVDIPTHRDGTDAVGGLYMTDEEETREEVFVYTSGVFDLLHYGHARHFEQAKKSFSKVNLIVGVLSDDVAMKLKGRVIQQCKDRAEALQHIRWVDEIIEAPPTPITMKFLQENRIDYVVSSSDLEYDEEASQWLKENGRFVQMLRTPGISTSNIMLRILRNYETYIKRSLERGVGREDLKIGYTTAKSIKLKSSIQNWRQKVTTEVHKATLTDHPLVSLHLNTHIRYRGTNSTS